MPQKLPRSTSGLLLPVMLLLGLFIGHGGAYNTPSSYVAPAMGVLTATLDGNDLPWLESAKESTVVVETPRWHGSGAVIGRVGDVVFILTARHVTDTYTEFVITTQLGVEDVNFQGFLVRESSTNDIALISVLDPGHLLKPLPLAKGVPAEGDLCYSIGYPSGLYPAVVMVGRYQGLGFLEEGVEIIRYDAGTWFGNSGGPIVNKRGQLIGMCNWGWDRNGHPTSDLGGGESIYSILDFLEAK